MIPNRLNKNLVFFQILLGILALLLVSGVFTASYITKEEQKLQIRIYPNVYIDNVHVGRKTKSEAIKMFLEREKKLQSSSITVLYKDQAVATLSAKALGVKSNVVDMIDRAYLIGRVSYLPSRAYQKFSTLFNTDKFSFTTTISYDKRVINEFVTDKEQRYNKPAKNALFQFENNRVVSFRQEEKGAKIKSDKFHADIEKIVESWKKKPSVKAVGLEEEIILPEITLAKSNQFGIEELIAEGRSNFAGSIPERIHNIILASSKFNGVLVPPKSIFSFNETVGDISSSTGFKPAYIIKSGKTVLGDGGGVCQVSTTLFRAALNSGLPIVERVAHAYRVGYYENDSKPGFDATVYAPPVDLKIKNDTPGHILIQTEYNTATGDLAFRIFGKKDGRDIEISIPTLYDVQPPPDPLYQDDPTLKKGTTKQVDFAAWGGKSNFNYKVTKPDGTIFEKNFFSSYRPWQAVFLVGQSD
ncbi:VanW family protein [Candidatus Roizmanbacteria bacterium]|nr:VanW family protein [Candidatus Roizmanbacteria bacterium]